MEDLKYEHLLRKAHQCPLDGVIGANASWFRSLLRQESQSKDSYDSFLSYTFYLGQVTAFILTAVSIIQSSHYLTEDQRKQISKAEGLLCHPTNVERICEAINLADEVVTDLGLPLK